MGAVAEDSYKIFGVGLNKTGTTTLEECFVVLGLGPISPSSGDDDAHRCTRQALAGTYQPAVEYARRYRCFQDRPWNIGELYRELATAFPDARFVLTRRAPQRWWRSVERWLSVSKPGKLDEYCRHLGVDPALAAPGVHALREPMLERYSRHNQEVVDFFAGSGRLLVIDFESAAGWEELCDFFELPVPAEPLPHANRQHYDVRDNKKRIQRIVKKARRRAARFLGLR